MKFRYECLNCHINQILKVAKIVGLDEVKKEEIFREVLDYLSKTNYDKSNPEMMQKTCEIIGKVIGNDNPYSVIKREFNDDILAIYDDLYASLKDDNKRVYKAIQMVIEGNVIDYGAKHSFTKEALLNKLLDFEHVKLAIDDRHLLYGQLKEAESLLYIGDNCGEIVLDKLFIQILKEEFPNLDVTFVVRGAPILNDATIEDAAYICLNEVTKFIDNGSGAPGTVLESVSEEFLDLFNRADVIIAKGQGNYESLSDVKGKNLFLMLMAKCELVSRDLNVNLLDKVCTYAN